MRINKGIKCLAIGMVIGTIITAIIYWLGSIGETCSYFWECLTCQTDVNQVRQPTFGDFWLWDSFFNYIVFISGGCGIIGFLYGFFTAIDDDDDDPDVNIISAIIACVILVVVYFLTTFFIFWSTE